MEKCRNADAGLKQLTTGKNANVGLTFAGWKKTYCTEGMVMGKVKKQGRFIPLGPVLLSCLRHLGRAGQGKRVGNYRTKYRPQDLLKALQAVREKMIGAREAAKKFEVPSRTGCPRKVGNGLGVPLSCPQRRMRSSWIGYWSCHGGASPSAATSLSTSSSPTSTDWEKLPGKKQC